MEQGGPAVSTAAPCTMSECSESVSEEERSLFRPFTRESLAAIEMRIAEQEARHRELERKRAEGEVSVAGPGSNPRAA